jgi:hypothetical protein
LRRGVTLAATPLRAGAVKPSPKLEYRRDGDWLVVRSAGQGSAAWLMGLFQQVGKHVSKEPAAAVVIDLREVTALPLTTTERYRVGEVVAKHWPGVPAAVVANAPLVDPERFAEMVARNRGVDGRVFTNMDEARAWLKERIAARAGGDTRPPGAAP